ncbi:uncharacterized protein PHACADRAFT_82476 [Phanerochaete carnosa HHB-10118-sp]|uniref:Rab-GAP TBC domain-containing protein n=1 Tax=Phanerochaete carnosa (strain HHB-10118-sp) TaxID=650164 RepID=K5VB84_PHACS|nr:uncharacterized protein PHACADRAFT_82476 [Phanerochaete carnosa HHB-10118-sp]EKM60161.1 hypothetical protein PHACADRAFT_82476 [Phanerochaete carnosa HHB-10118-sp]
MASSLRAASPAFSMFSGIGARTAPAPASRTDMLATITSESKGGKQSEESKEGVEAHRQRELRWISAISSVPAAQARKNKKVRKLLWEGVPASVRYIVWAHLTDSKAKRTENVYYKLTQRERVPAAANIERDLRRVFPEDHQLHDGSLLNVLQAYLMMVPDTHYSRGLTVIAGHLLLQSPEEDAFWTFVSLMDTHVRSYFSASPAQMEIDSTLFGKAVESNDSAMAKKVFVEMDIPPTSLCRPWFTALFLEALPLEHSQRVWDIFLFEGAPFLFRVGLAIMMRCKQQVMQCAQRDMILNLLLHPPASMLPATADAFLELTTAVKLKDEDVRKQRAKLAEAHVKRQNLARTFASQAGLPGLPAISLPRK